jgi:hypothetical protein
MDRCPDGETPGESPQEMSDRVDRVIAKIRKLHQQVCPLARFSPTHPDKTDKRPKTIALLRRQKSSVMF